MKKIIEILNKEIEISKNNDEIPVGAVIVNSKTNEIISSGHNNRQHKYNVLGHAEINAIIKAEKKIKDWRLNGYTMYVNLQPCNICSDIIFESRLDQVVYFINNNNVNKERKINELLIKDEDYNTIKEKYKNDIRTFFKNKR